MYYKSNTADKQAVFIQAPGLWREIDLNGREETQFFAKISISVEIFGRGILRLGWRGESPLTGLDKALQTSVTINFTSCA